MDEYAPWKEGNCTEIGRREKKRIISYKREKVKKKYNYLLLFILGDSFRALCVLHEMLLLRRNYWNRVREMGSAYDFFCRKRNVLKMKQTFTSMSTQKILHSCSITSNFYFFIFIIRSLHFHDCVGNSLSVVENYDSKIRYYLRIKQHEFDVR